MSKQQMRLLLCAVASLALLVPAMFMDWFVVEAPGARISMSMTSSTACAEGQCRSISLYMLGGMYSRLSRMSFGGGVILILLVLFQGGTKLFTDHAHPKLSRMGYVGGSFLLAATIIFAFFIGPNFGGSTRQAFALLGFERTLAPMMFIAGVCAALAALYYAAHDGYDDTGGEYKPVVVPRKDIPVTPISMNRVPHPGTSDSGRIPKPTPPGSEPLAKPGSGPHRVERVITPPARERIPDSIPFEDDSQARTSDSGPVPKQSAQSGSGPIPKHTAQSGSGPNVARTTSPDRPADRPKSPSQPGS